MTLRWIVFGASASLLVALAGCGASARPASVPDVTEQPLDSAEDALDARDLRYDVVGGGAFGIVVRSHWAVCRQVPASGSLARHVTLYVARSCASPSPPVVPNVIGYALPEAEDELERDGLRPRGESVDGAPVIVDARWSVCDQFPAGGETAADRTVELYVAHDCWQDG